MFFWIKIILIFLAAVCFLIILLLAVLWLPIFNKTKPIEFGVSFSKPYAEELGLDWREAYLAVLDDLGVQYLRLNSEWDKIETTENSYDFSALDWQISEAEKRGIKVILVVGHRQPRWPECHTPEWLSDALPIEMKEYILEFIRTTVNRYKNSPAVEIWQVENEPFLNIFGECPRGSLSFLKQEIDLVRSLDNRQVLITDSGELSSWFRTAKMGDNFGISVYKVVHNRYFGYFNHFLPPAFYRLKAKFVGLPQNRIIISELQAEPWMINEKSKLTDLESQKKIMGLEKISKQINFAGKTGFSRAYLWGVEWWYWLKTQGDDSIWQMVKGVWKE